MALIKCKECGSEVSDSAKTCPKCGAPVPKGTSLLTVIVGFILVMFFIGMISNNMSSNSETPEQIAESQKSSDNINNAIQASHFLKKSLRDPDSLQYEHVIATDNGTICYEYRAKNGFGGMNSGKAFYLPKDDKFRTSEMDSFGKIWKTECAGKRGQNIAL